MLSFSRTMRYGYYLRPNNVNHMTSKAKYCCHDVNYQDEKQNRNFEKNVAIHKKQHHVFTSIGWHGYKELMIPARSGFGKVASRQLPEPKQLIGIDNRGIDKCQVLCHCHAIPDHLVKIWLLVLWLKPMCSNCYLQCSDIEGSDGLIYHKLWVIRSLIRGAMFSLNCRSCCLRET